MCVDLEGLARPSQLGPIIITYKKATMTTSFW